MISCILIDDEPHALELLESYLHKVQDATLVFKSTDPVEAFQFLQNHTVDLIFLDIHMPELNGIQMLKLLNGTCKVILTTAYAEYALQGYEHDVIDYLVKPIEFDRFLKAFHKAKNQIYKTTSADASLHHTVPLPQDEDYILVKTETKGKLIKAGLQDITHIEGLGNYVTIHTLKGKIISLITLRELEQKLSTHRFIRIHKSFIIALPYIDMIEGNMVLINKNKIPIGESYKSRLMDLLANKMIQKGE